MVTLVAFVSSVGGRSRPWRAREIHQYAALRLIVTAPRFLQTATSSPCVQPGPFVRRQYCCGMRSFAEGAIDFLDDEAHYAEDQQQKESDRAQ